MCEPPMITRHTSKMFVMEGQEVSLRCRSLGDPEPSTHWVGPDGRLLANTSRTVCYDNGSLDILKASVKVGPAPPGPRLVRRRRLTLPLSPGLRQVHLHRLQRRRRGHRPRRAGGQPLAAL